MNQHRRIPDENVRRTPRSVVILNDHGWVNGGQAEMAITSALELRRRGLDVCFIAGLGPLDERLIDAGVECRVAGDHDILSDPDRVRAARRGLWNRRSATLLSESLARREPSDTVIHVHGWAKALSPSIGPIVTGSRAAHVYTLHEYFLGCPNGGFYDYQANEICTRRALGADCLRTNCDPRSSAHKAWRVTRQAILWSAGKMPRDLRELIFLAPQQQQILGPYIHEDARWHYLPNPIAAAEGPPVRAEENTSFLFVGRLSPEKGAVIVAKAARQSGVPIAFCGSGDETGAIIAANPDAEMLGWLSKAGVDEAMRRARCVVFPSLWYEAFGLVVGDAMRRGVPVIVSRDCVAANLVSEGRSGLLATAGDVDAWADAMIRMTSNDVVREMATSSFAAGHDLIGQEEHTARLLGIYRQALERKNRAALVEREAAR